MIKDLNQIYNPTDPGDQHLTAIKGPNPKKGTITDPGEHFIRSRTRAPQNMVSLSNVDLNDSDVQKQFSTTGVPNPTDMGKDLETLLGERQSFGEQLGRKMANLVPNVAADLLDIVGNVGSLLTEWGDNRDYSNTLNEIASGMKDPFGRAYHHDNSTWAIGDSAWWLDNMFSTLEYAGAFAIGGSGIGGLLKAGAKGISAGLNLGKTASLLVRGAAQLGTSATVSYAEAAQAGAQVFQEVYNAQRTKLIASGMDPMEAQTRARHIAAQSAATTAQLGTLLTMGLNVGAYGGIFKKQEDVVTDIITKRLAQEEGATMGTLGKVARGLNASDYTDKLFHHNSVKQIAREMVGEGAEEFVQQYAQDAGTDMGKNGKVKGFFEQFGDIENMLDRTANSVGLLNFVLGAAFGGLQHGLLHNVIPSRRVEQIGADGTPVQKLDAEGNPVLGKNGEPVIRKTWVTPRKYEADFTRRSFNSVRDALAADFEHQADLENNLLKAVGAKNRVAAEEARDQIFEPTRLHAIKYGMSQPLIRSFEKIAAMDNEQVDENGQTEAMRAGYATEAGTTDHVEKAKDAIESLDHLTDMYRKITEHYGTKYEANAGLEPLVDMVFARSADNYMMKKRIDRFQKEIDQSKKTELEMAQILDPHGFSELVDRYSDQHSSARAVGQQLAADHKTLMDSVQKKDAKSVERLLRKYRAIGMGDGDINLAVKDLDRKLRAKMDEVNQRVVAAESNMQAATEYESWKTSNPDKTFGDFVKEAAERRKLASTNSLLESQLEGYKAQYEISQQNLSDMTKEKNAIRFSRKVTEWNEKLRKEAEEVEKQQNATLAAMAKDKATVTKLSKIELNKKADFHADRADALQKRMAAVAAEIEGLKQGSWWKNLITSGKLKDAQHQYKYLEKRYHEEKANEAKYRVDITDPVTAVPVETVTGETTGTSSQESQDNPTTDTNTNPTEEDLFSDLMQTGQGEFTDMPPTIEDEMELMRQLTQTASMEEYNPIGKFHEELKTAHQDIKVAMDSIFNGFVSGSMGYSLDLLNNFVREGKITQPNAARLLQLANEAAKEIQRMEAEASSGTEVPPPTEDSEEQKPEVQVSGVEPPDTPPITTLSTQTTTVPPSADYHAGFKIVNAAETGATTTIGYEEGVRKGKNGKKDAYVKVTKPTELNQVPGLTDILLPGHLLPGHDLRFEVDVDYDGPKQITDSLSWDGKGEVVQEHEKGSDYLDSNGKVKSANKTVYEPAHPPIVLEALRKGVETIVRLSDGSVLNVRNEIRGYSKDSGTMVGYEKGKAVEFPLSSVVSVSDMSGNNILYRNPGAKTQIAHDPKMMGNVPIKVVDAKTGKTLFHLRKLDWLHAKFEGTEDYRNIADKIPTPDGDSIDNLALQTARLLEIRQHVVDKFNNEGKATDARISHLGKGTGRLIMNQVIDEKNPDTLEIKSHIGWELANNRNNPDKSMLPDKNLELVIVGDGSVLNAGHNYPSTKELGIVTKDLVKGGVGALVPAANGKHLFAPLVGMRLAEEGKPSVALNSIVRAIELFLLNDGTNLQITNEISDLENKTGFDISTAQGLKAFINQYYTYSQKFPDSALSPNASGVKAEQFLFSIDPSLKIADKTKQVKLGFSMRGDGAHYANLVGGKLDPSFVQALHEGLKTRSRAVVFTNNNLGVRGINSTGKFYEANYVPGKGWMQHEHESYNEYVKSFSKTPVYGRNQLNGKYVYTANPHLNFEVPGLRQEAALVVPADSAKDIKQQQAPEWKASADLFDNIYNFSVGEPEVVKAFATGLENSKPLDMKTLQEIYNFTPEVQRNGKTVLEVLTELTARGHSYIPEGYNPFSRCS